MKQAMNEHIEIIRALTKEFEKTEGTLYHVEKAIEAALIIGKTAGFKAAIVRVQNKLDALGYGLDIEALAYGAHKA
jgi:hypothetical protein